MLKFENPSNGRFYYLAIINDFFNDCVLRLIYGGRYVSRTRIIKCGNRDELVLAMEKMAKRRVKRGYYLRE